MDGGCHWCVCVFAAIASQERLSSCSAVTRAGVHVFGEQHLCYTVFPMLEDLAVGSWWDHPWCPLCGLLALVLSGSQLSAVHMASRGVAQ